MALYDRTAESQTESGPVDRFRDYLKHRNLRLTPERRVVLETMLRREGHFDAQRAFAGRSWTNNRNYWIHSMRKSTTTQMRKSSIRPPKI